MQSRESRAFTEEEVEDLLTVAMILAEITVDDERTGGRSGRLESIRLAQVGPETLSRQDLRAGPRAGAMRTCTSPPVAPADMIAKDSAKEAARLEEGIASLRASVDAMVSGESAQMSRASKDIFETYRMFAYDRKWVGRLREAVQSGLTAEAAVERVRSEHRVRLQKARDPYLRARLHDLEDLANRMLRALSGDALAPRLGQDGRQRRPVRARPRPGGTARLRPRKARGHRARRGRRELPHLHRLPSARHPARGSLPGRGQPLRPGHRHRDGRRRARRRRNGRGATSARLEGQTSAFSMRLDVRGEMARAYAAQRLAPCITRDGRAISLQLNAGLLVDLPQLDAHGRGRHRAVPHRVPVHGFRVHAQTRKSRPTPTAKRFMAAGERPVTFRTLDLGGDKILPYIDPVPEANPAIGWRAIRIGLDRPGLVRYQSRALLQAARGQHLRVMFPMVTTVDEFISARDLFDREVARASHMGDELPTRIEVGVMLETPSLAWQINAICDHADFVSVGCNDLLQFFFAADRDNPRVSDRYDTPPPGGALDHALHRLSLRQERRPRQRLRRDRRTPPRGLRAGKPRLRQPSPCP